MIALRAEYRNPKLVSSLNSIGIIHETQGGYRWTAEDDIRVSNEIAMAVNGYELSVGEIGCAMAHVKAYKRLLESPEKFLVVIEDDAVMEHQFDLEIFTSLMDTDVPQVLLLGRNFLDLPVLTKQLGKFGSADVFVDNLPPTGTFAYIVNRSAAELMSKEFELDGVNFTADWPLSAVERATFLYCYPPLFSSGNSTSLIERPGSANRSKQFSSIYRALRYSTSRDRRYSRVIRRLYRRHARIRFRRLVLGLSGKKKNCR